MAETQSPASAVQKGRVPEARNVSRFFNGFLRNYKMRYKHKKNKRKRYLSSQLRLQPKLSVTLVQSLSTLLFKF